MSGQDERVVDAATSQHEDDIDSKIQRAVDAALTRHQDVTMSAASTVAETIASKFIEKQEKALEDTPIDLKGKGNRHQFQFCKTIETKFEKVSECIKRKDLNKAVDYIEEGKKLISKRKKLIKLADRENWATVNEYVSDDMASDSEDEKRINRAKRAAAAKLEKEKRSRRRSATSRSRNNFPSNYFTNNTSQPRSLRTNQSKICWGCGRHGHFYSDCPLNMKPYNNFERDNRSLKR